MRANAVDVSVRTRDEVNVEARLECVLPPFVVLEAITRAQKCDCAMSLGSWNFRKLMSLSSEGDFPTMVTPLLNDVRLSFRSNIRALIVDDSTVCRTILKVSLAKLGVESKEAENGQVAVDMFHEETFDIVFMNKHMPVMGGIQATSTIRVMGITVKIIGLTADSSHPDVFLGAGIDELWVKPFRMVNLISVLREVDGSI